MRVVDPGAGGATLSDSNRTSFDAIAETYASTFVNELDEKPFDRQLLETFPAHQLSGRSRPTALDLGTGAAGHIGRFLYDRGWDVTGVDFSSRSVDVARRLQPEMSFVVADFRSLPFEDQSVDGAVAFYSFIYGTDDDIVRALDEVRRVLRPGRRLLAAVHGALDDVPTERRYTEFQGISVEMVVRYTTPATFAGLAERAGLRIHDLRVRDPYESEHPSRRIYLQAGT